MMGLVDLGDVMVDPWRVEFITPGVHAREGATIHLQSGAAVRTTHPYLEAQRLLDEGKAERTVQFEQAAEDRATQRVASAMRFPTPISASEARALTDSRG